MAGTAEGQGQAAQGQEQQAAQAQGQAAQAQGQQQQVSAQVVAAAALAVAQAQANLPPPTGLGNFPLAAGDVVGDSLLTCGFTSNHAQYALCVTEGLDSLQSFADLELLGIDELHEALAKRSQTQGGYRMTATQVLSLKALVWWLKDSVDRGQAIGQAFTADDLSQARAEYQAYERIRRNPVDIERPTKYPSHSHQWVNWWESVKNYLATQMGVRRRSLAYVIRPSSAPPNPSPEQTAMHQVTLQGPEYKVDNASVYQILKSLTLNTTAYPWIQTYDRTQNGRDAALSLMRQNEGTGQLHTRHEQAKNELQELFYQDEQAFSFQTYTSKLRGIFTTMEQAGRAKTPEEQVEYLIDKIRADGNNALLNTKMAARRDHSNNFENCVAFIAGEIAAYTAPPTRRARGRRISELNTEERNVRGRFAGNPGRGHGRGRSGRRGDGRYGGRGRGRGGASHRNAATHINGVDVSDPTRNFSDEEFSRLGTTGQRFVHEERRRINNRSRNTGGRGDRSINAMDSQETNHGANQGESQDNDTQGSNNNGNSFGRGARGRGRGRRS